MATTLSQGGQRILISVPHRRERSVADEDYPGIDRERAHPHAQALIPDDFFWDGGDDLSPFGSDEGFTALAEWRAWRAKHPRAAVRSCLQWVVRSVGEMPLAAYTDALASPARVQQLVADPQVDDWYEIFTLDISIIATVLGQFVDEGVVDASALPFLQRALNRQSLYAAALPAWDYAPQWAARVTRLSEISAQIAAHHLR
ncbi:hypothetical protein [Buchananella hordeovulneris]|uniref:hypothetical protein n=1 Tax=Buchananella hordeovulneris TaxID=52770 RepID=UPI001160F655|nr:hypothetical protein [Buchananella hordeovulneris]